MENFKIKLDGIICKKCGSCNVRVKAGMLVDTFTCLNCGTQEHG